MSPDIKDFSGYMTVCPYPLYNLKMVERTVRKAEPDDPSSTLWVLKLKGVHEYVCLYESELVSPTARGG